MKKYCSLLFLFALTTTAFAQSDKSDRDDRKQEIRDNTQERKAIAKEKVDYNLFRRQMLALPEYIDERKKIPALQKASKMSVKIVAYVDTVDNLGDDAKNTPLTGYISEVVGYNTTNMFEVSYDRALKKIVAVKATGETSDIDAPDDAAKTTPGKKATTKKAKDEDEDDDADDDKPAKKRPKDDE